MGKLEENKEWNLSYFEKHTLDDWLDLFDWNGWVKLVLPSLYLLDLITHPTTISEPPSPLSSKSFVCPLHQPTSIPSSGAPRSTRD